MIKSQRVEKSILYIFLTIIFLALVTSCTSSSNLDESNKKDKKRYLDKIRQGIILKSNELSNLSGILLYEEDYNEAITIFENLKELEGYKENKSNIYFNLASFYAGKAKTTRNSQNKQELIYQSAEYIEIAFNNTPEKPRAFYKRAQAYAMLGCIEKAKIDKASALESAKSKDLIMLDDGIYVTYEKYEEILENVTEWFDSVRNNCTLDN